MGSNPAAPTISDSCRVAISAPPHSRLMCSSLRSARDLRCLGLPDIGHGQRSGGIGCASRSALPLGNAVQVSQPSRRLSACRSRRADADGLAVLQGSATRIRAQTGVAEPLDSYQERWRSEGSPRAPRGLPRQPAFTSPRSTHGKPSEPMTVVPLDQRCPKLSG